MKTLKEMGFEVNKEDDIYKRLDGNLDKIMNLTQEQAASEEIAWNLGSDWFDFFEDKVNKFGGRIVWDEESPTA